MSNRKIQEVGLKFRYLHIPVPVHVPGTCQTSCDDRLKAGPFTRRPASPRVPEGWGPGLPVPEWLEPSGTSGTLYLFFRNSHEKNVQKKDPGKCWQCAGSAGQKGKKNLIAGKSYEKMVHKKDLGNRENFAFLPYKGILMECMIAS